jgi:hypothetical protein
MKILQVLPRRDADEKLTTLLSAKERELRGSRTTFYRKKAGRWAHKGYPGWIGWSEAKGGILIAEIHGKEEAEWQLLRAFVGYLDRHLSDHIESITIIYR